MFSVLEVQRSNPKPKLALAALLAVGAAAVPTAASAATPIPPLSTGDTQAYAALTAGGARITSPITRTFSGVETGNGAGGFSWTCTVSVTIVLNTNGTTSVTNATFSNCTTNVPGCNVAAVATNMPWGNRLVRDSSGTYRDRINVQFTKTFSGTCPAPAGAYTYTGVLSPRLTGGTPASATFDAASGSVTSPLGPATLSGTLNGAAGQSTHFRL